MVAAESLDRFESLWFYMAFYLRFERQKHQLSQSQMGQIMGINKYGVSNFEAGRNRLTQEQARRIDQKWETGGFWEGMRGFALKYGRNEEWAKQLRDFETGAMVVKMYHGRVIPVPLQTEDYARALITAGRMVVDVEEAVRARMARQALLLEQLPRMRLWILLDQRALEEAPNGDPALMRAQLAHIRELSERVSVRVVPRSVHAHIGVDGDFELITTASGKDVAYVWAQLGGRLVGDSTEVRVLSQRYDTIGAQAKSEDDSRESIRKSEGAP
ncbi:helix-turn-helix domain-containing protein [Actinomadura harenae]|uniref:XRE family transcriptional regulator n=1 Tax=Actinomadura harenae TaxID=2483351 RepID=A0A3M2M6J8_9ACTN|nr:helix-turn-helix transcriptional regulator [Actinomadura harenae]RMI44483.1 XRE family transcriptional regulator [Actinomadura harenae]